MQPQERDRGGVGHGGCARQTRWAPRPGQAEDGQGRSEAERAEAIERLLDPEALPKTWPGGWRRAMCCGRGHGMWRPSLWLAMRPRAMYVCAMYVSLKHPRPPRGRYK